MRRRTGAFASIAAAALLATTPTVETAESDTDFYTSPPAFETAPLGDVLRTASSVAAVVPKTPAVLDAAVTRVMYRSGLDPDDPIAFWGYSQGGMASASAAELAATYAPELSVVGAVAGSPPADLGDLAVAGDGSLLSGGIGWVVDGFISATSRGRRWSSSSNSATAPRQCRSSWRRARATTSCSSKGSTPWSTSGARPAPTSPTAATTSDPF